MFNESTWIESERKVQEYMKNRGYKILLTNFSCVGVELDIVALLPKSVQVRQMKVETSERIAEDKKNKSIYRNSLKNALKVLEDLLIVVEVKGRESDKYGFGAESISEHKKHNIIRGARFLQTQPKLGKYQIRFDVASVDDGKITYIENAF